MRTQRAVYNTIVMMVYQIATIVCGLILPRLIISNFGSSYNGILASITQFLAAVSILRLGVAGATRVELYKSIANNDIDRTSGIVLATEKFMHRIALFIIVYVGILALAFPYFVDNSLNKSAVVSLVLILGLSSFVEYFFGITNTTLLDADQKGYVYYSVQTIITILNTFISYLLIMRGADLVTIKFTCMFLLFIRPVFVFVYVRKKYKINPSAKIDNSALKKRGPVMVQSIANIVHENTDVIVLTLFSSVKIVSVYSVYQYVFYSIQKAMDVFTNSLEAGFGGLFAKDERVKIKRNFEIYEFFIASFISIVFASAGVLILPFVSLYTSGVNDVQYVNPTYAVFGLLAMAVLCFRQPYRTIVQAAGLYKETKNASLFEALINITLSISLVIKYGLIGVVIGTLCANLFRTAHFIWFVSTKVINRGLTDSIKMIVWICFNITISIFTFEYFSSSAPIDSWFDWINFAILIVLTSFLITGLSTLVFWRERAVDLFNKFFRKRKNVS